MALGTISSTSHSLRELSRINRINQPTTIGVVTKVSSALKALKWCLIASIIAIIAVALFLLLLINAQTVLGITALSHLQITTIQIGAGILGAISFIVIIVASLYFRRVKGLNEPISFKQASVEPSTTPDLIVPIVPIPAIENLPKQPALYDASSQTSEADHPTVASPWPLPPIVASDSLVDSSSPPLKESSLEVSLPPESPRAIVEPEVPLSLKDVRLIDRSTSMAASSIGNSPSLDSLPLLNKTSRTSALLKTVTMRSKTLNGRASFVASHPRRYSFLSDVKMAKPEPILEETPEAVESETIQAIAKATTSPEIPHVLNSETLRRETSNADVPDVLDSETVRIENPKVEIPDVLPTEMTRADSTDVKVAEEAPSAKMATADQPPEIGAIESFVRISNTPNIQYYPVQRIDSTPVNLDGINSPYSHIITSGPSWVDDNSEREDYYKMAIVTNAGLLVSLDSGSEIAEGIIQSSTAEGTAFLKPGETITLELDGKSYQISCEIENTYRLPKALEKHTTYTKQISRLNKQYIPFEYWLDRVTIKSSDESLRTIFQFRANFIMTSRYAVSEYSNILIAQLIKKLEIKLDKKQPMVVSGNGTSGQSAQFVLLDMMRNFVAGMIYNNDEKNLKAGEILGPNSMLYLNKLYEIALNIDKSAPGPCVRSLLDYFLPYATPNLTARYILLRATIDMVSYNQQTRKQLPNTIDELMKLINGKPGPMALSEFDKAITQYIDEFLIPFSLNQPLKNHLYTLSPVERHT